MKYLLLPLLLATAYSAPAQSLPVLPNPFNRFIASANISWAADVKDGVGFADARPVKGKNIHTYLIQKAAAGQLRIGTASIANLTGISATDAAYAPYHKMSKVKLPPMVPADAPDTNKAIGFHEIWYLDNYRLKSVTLSAAPLADVVTSTGINLGQRNTFFCCGEKKQAKADKSGLIFLKTVTRRLVPDSMVGFSLLKQSFGMTLAQALWYGASKGRGTLTDVATGQTIAPRRVLSYIADTTAKIAVPVYDSLGNITAHKTFGDPPVFPRKLNDGITVEQDIYFDRKRDRFITNIKACYLYISTWASDGKWVPSTRYFKLVFP
jgi:hypothetical protein